jgi:hypothetical protein
VSASAEEEDDSDSDTASEDSQHSEDELDLPGVHTRAQVKEHKVGNKAMTKELTPKILHPDLELALHFVAPYSVNINGRRFVRTLASNYRTKLFLNLTDQFVLNRHLSCL